MQRDAGSDADGHGKRRNIARLDSLSVSLNVCVQCWFLDFHSEYLLLSSTAPSNIVTVNVKDAWLHYSMRSIAISDPVAWCVSLSVTRLCCAKTAARIEVPFVTEILGDTRHIVLDGGPDSPPATGGVIRCGPSPNFFGNLFIL